MEMNLHQDVKNDELVVVIRISNYQLDQMDSRHREFQDGSKAMLLSALAELAFKEEADGSPL